jgi:putative N6-adenine-specific DNA methylase
VSPRREFFATCAPGLEPLLHEEVRALKLAKVERQVGGVRFEGTLQDAWRANLWLRTAVRVLQRVSRFEARNESELYEGASAVDWSLYLSAGGTLRVDAHSNASALEHTLFVEQRTKDAVVDQLREKHGARPSVDLEAPDLGVYVHLFRDRCTLLVDTSGDSLHKRGWRTFQGQAPLAETLAAACVLASGWDRRAPLVDPMCGSGTLLIEAALIAGGVAPGSFRQSFGFERWPGHDARAWLAMRAEARAAARFPSKLILRGRDADARTLEGARANLRSAGLEQRIELELGRVEDFEPRRGWNAWLVCNPPYGERIGQERELVPLYKALGALMRERCKGWHATILSGNTRLARALELEPARRTALKNGALDCELLAFEL